MRCDAARYTGAMPETALLLILVLAAILVALVLLVLLLLRRPDASVQQALREEQRDGRAELRQQLDSFSTQQELRIDGFASRLNEAAGRTDQRLEDLREALTEDARKARQEAALALKDFAAALDARVGELTRNNEQRIGEMRATLEQKLRELQVDNAAKLEQMRATVDEKLHATLETRLTESFGNVTAMLAQVHQGLGDMNKLAADVGGLQRVLGNVKSRGVFGEVQLAGLLEQVFAPDQYAANVATLPDSSERVEFAVRFPGSSGEAPVWLPIDAKFPREDYERLLDAQERGDVGRRACGRRRAGTARAPGGCAHPRQIRRPAAHDRIRDPVPADRRPVRRNPAPPGAGRGVAARPAHRRRRSDHAAGADDQLPDGLPHAGDPGAFQRSVAHAWARSRPSSASSATCSTA